MKILCRPKGIFKLGLALCLLFAAQSCSSQEEEVGQEEKEPTTRIINFSGFEWVVRTSGDQFVGPGPNLFSDSKENVWVDDQGRLHLKIVEKGGNWFCSGITLRKNYGHNKYVFYVSSRVDQLDPNVVAGLFTYKNDEEEIDIEFSRWSDPDNEDSQFAVQPSYLTGNKVRYDLDLNGPLSTHWFNWQESFIEFGSYRGHTLEPEEEDIIHEWRYSGDNIPPDVDERLKINLWLFRGTAPSNLQEAEMVIDRVEIY